MKDETGERRVAMQKLSVLENEGLVLVGGCVQPREDA